MAEARRKRVVSGMRPTGRLHIGHYFGALQNWIKLQNDPEYECFYFIADWHALTSDYADTSAVAQNVVEIMTDYLAAGLDPKKSVIFQQSRIPQHAELHLLLSMVTPLGWLERVPTYKEALENVKDKDLHRYGFLGYPVLQAADIVIYQADFVPVGEDQAAHVELTREIVRALNIFYPAEANQELFSLRNRDDLVGLLKIGDGPPYPSMPRGDERLSQDRIQELKAEVSSRVRRLGPYHVAWPFMKRRGWDRYFLVLREPEVLLTETPRILGTDGRKMSKSYRNDISLSESDESIRAKTKVMVTDPARKRRENPGNPDICPVYDWHKLFSPPEILKWSAHGCRTAEIGCIECKAAMADHLIKWIAPIRERRQEYEKSPGRVLEILDEGSKKARAVAQKTMERVREAVFGSGKKREEVRGPAMKSAEAKR